MWMFTSDDVVIKVMLRFTSVLHQITQSQALTQNEFLSLRCQVHDVNIHTKIYECERSHHYSKWKSAYLLWTFTSLHVVNKNVLSIKNITCCEHSHHYIRWENFSERCCERSHQMRENVHIIFNVLLIKNKKNNMLWTLKSLL